MIHDPGIYEIEVTNSAAAFVVSQIGIRGLLSYMWLVCPMTSCTPWWYGPLTSLRAFKDAGACYSPKSCKL